jgi:hypothetical protein
LRTKNPWNGMCANSKLLLSPEAFTPVELWFTEGIAYLLLRALQDDVDEADLCGAAPCRALGVSPEWHPDLIAGLVSVPEVMPGDTVFWHTEICHTVGDEHAGSEYASVIYIGSAPDRPKSAPIFRTETSLPPRVFSPRLLRHGLRSRFQGSRNRAGSDRPRPRPNGLLTRVAVLGGHLVE